MVQVEKNSKKKVVIQKWGSQSNYDVTNPEGLLPEEQFREAMGSCLNHIARKLLMKNMEGTGFSYGIPETITVSHEQLDFWIRVNLLCEVTTEVDA